MTIRLKLAIGFIAVIFMANALLFFVNIVYLERVWLDEVQSRVRLDLNSARAAYDNHLERIEDFLQTVRLAHDLGAELRSQDPQKLRPLLEKLYHGGPVDFLDLLDERGQVLLRVQNPPGPAGSLAANPLIAQTLREKKAVAGTVVVSHDELAAESPELARRAKIDLVPTREAQADDQSVLSRGMLMAASVPILNASGDLLGVLYGGELLNRREGLVDTIRDEVFPREIYQGEQLGTVTLFLNDVRISTNVIAEDGNRALGTRLSAEVCSKVIEQGRTFASRAFVVDEWYISAYGPIRDPQGTIVGALYVGLKEAPFVAKRNWISGVVLALTAVATATSLLLILLITTFVLRPISRVTEMARRVIAGDLAARVGIRPPGEMGILCQAVDAMAESAAQREADLKQTTRRQIGHSEKLASIGRLAAGVAHEINNPLTGVLTFAHLLRDKPNMDDQDRQDLDLIIHETSRAAEIVRGLLDFARERPALKEPLDLNDVVRRTVRLIRNQKLFERIVIQEELGAGLPAVEGDMNQLQQVLLNLSLNACEAMPNGGTLTISTGRNGDRVQVKLVDTGCGISREHFAQIFEPFFTTKPVGKGTGLGLSVSYGIVQQHGGALDVESEEGQGSTFTIWLPAMSETD